MRRAGAGGLEQLSCPPSTRRHLLAGRPAVALPAQRRAGPGGPRRDLSPAPEALGEADRLVVVETREAIPPGLGAGPADVDHQDGRPRAVGEELLVDARGVEAGHRSG